MLGRLAKWVRIIGYDAAYPKSFPAPNRRFLSTKKIDGAAYVLITRHDSIEQLKEILSKIGVRPDPKLFFSRCVVCNVPVIEIPKTDVAGRVPDQVFDSRSEFRECPHCRRVYWEGSHLTRIKLRLKSAGINLS